MYNGFVQTFYIIIIYNNVKMPLYKHVINLEHTTNYWQQLIELLNRLDALCKWFIMVAYLGVINDWEYSAIWMKSYQIIKRKEKIDEYLQTSLDDCIDSSDIILLITIHTIITKI